MSLHITVDMTEIPSGDCPSNRREGNVFVDKQVQAYSNCSFGITFYNLYFSNVKLANSLNYKTITLLLQNLNKNSWESLLQSEYIHKTSLF